MGQLIAFPTKDSILKDYSKSKQRKIATKIVAAIQQVALDDDSGRISVDTLQLAVNLYFQKHGTSDYPSK